jgi:hypothetical protein
MVTVDILITAGLTTIRITGTGSGLIAELLLFAPYIGNTGRPV